MSCLVDNEEYVQTKSTRKMMYYLKTKGHLYIDIVDDINDTEPYPRPVCARDLSKNRVSCNLCSINQQTRDFQDIKVSRVKCG